MSKLDTRASRRQFMRAAGAGAVAVSLAGLLRTPTAAADMPKLSLDDPSAKALAYTHESSTDGQLCNNCNFWQGGAAEWGGCPLFPGKAVAAKGWCKSWVKKA
jgi:anaerobic selenocysteine-containing dehydrogenase